MRDNVPVAKEHAVLPFLVYYLREHQPGYIDVVGYSFRMMFRAIVLILCTAISVQGQDSTLVREYCNVIGGFSATTDIGLQITQLGGMVESYLERNPTKVDSTLQGRLRFQYRLMRELKRSCPEYLSDRIALIHKPVIDLEDRFTEQQIDSLGRLILHIAKDKEVYVYILTIDDFYPDTSITDFANRYRDFWAPRSTPEKGVILVVFSTTQRQVRISTGDTSMTYLTDVECSEVNKAIIPHFKNGNYFEGLINGLLAIKSRV